MSAHTQRAFQHSSPQLRPAGKTTFMENESVAACMAGNRAGNERPSTPPEIAKYRKSAIHQVGVSVKHYGAADDKLPIKEGEAFGIKGKRGEEYNMAQVIQNYPVSEIMQWRRERQEDIYETHKREPLGQTALRGHQLPEGLGTERPFGTVIGAKSMMHKPLAKALIFPEDTPPPDDEATRQMYLKSHMAFAPGEQRRRDYKWPGIDPATFKFGKVDDRGLSNGVEIALNPSVDEDHKNHVTIVQKNLEAFKITNHHELGRPKSLGFGNRNLPEDHAFGMPSRINTGTEEKEWGARKVLCGEYSEAQQMPDADLGKAIRPGYRNIEPTDGRAFGLPSVRIDVNAPKKKALNDNMNYGGEPDASALLYPCPGADRGITEELYLDAYTKEQMLAFLEGAGVGTDNFDGYFAEAAAFDDFPGGDKCCLLTYRKVKRHYEAQELMAR